MAAALIAAVGSVETQSRTWVRVLEVAVLSCWPTEGSRWVGC